MLAVITGCNKGEDKKAVNSETVEPKATQPPVDNTADEKDAAAGEQGKETEAKADEGTANSSEPAGGDAATEPVKPTEAAVPVDTTSEGIKDVYAEYNMKAGTCLSDMMILMSKYSDIIKKNFNSITLENAMKPDSILNQAKSIAAGDIVVEYTDKTKQLLDWTKSNGMAARGHVIIWHSQTPEWIFHEEFSKSKPLVDRDTMLARMESYMKQVFGQLDTLGYSDMFYAFDVVNEAINDDGTYRDSLWKKIIGDDYIWYAFYYADKYAPESIKLYYNDYNEQFKTDHIVKLAESLVDEKGRSLIDGIGCQGHLYTQDSIDKYMDTLKAFSALGLDVQITELDVSLGTWMNILTPTEENLKAQGQFYYELINRIVTENAAGNTCVSGVTYWGFADELSWRRERNPVLYDKSQTPKYAYYGAMQDKEKAGY